MFHNIKNFIRHGKQANAMALNDPEYSAGLTKDDGVFEVTVDSPLDSFTIDTSNSTPRTSVSPIEDSEEQKEIKNVVIVNQDQDHEEQRRQSQQHAKAHKKKEDYSRMAADLVNEENIIRKQQEQKQALDRYQIEDKLGEGAFSVVYRAKDVVTGDYVAVKVIKRYQMDQAQQAAVFKEVTIMRQLNHPNVVQLLNFIETDEYYYIVQEIVPGGEIFAEVVRFTYLSEDLSRHIIIQLAEAIKYLHEEVGVVHRDIKPENILFNTIDFIPSKEIKYRKSDDRNTKKDEGEFTYNLGGGGIGIVKLADFGLSKQIWENNTKTPCGTVGYTAPEIVRDERYSKEVDMWAIGCVLYILLCGFPPFYDERIESLTEKVARGKYVFLSPWWDEISDDAKYCVSRLLTVNPAKRYTIEEFLKDPWIVEFKTKSAEADRLRKLREQQLEERVAHTPVYSMPPHILARKTPRGYSPAAVALKEAFDISAAVHRMGEEAALNKYKTDRTKRRHNDPNQLASSTMSLGSLQEEGDEAIEAVELGEINKLHNGQRHRIEKENTKGNVISGDRIFATPQDSLSSTAGSLNPEKTFNLDMNTASILARRRKKGGAPLPKLVI